MPDDEFLALLRNHPELWETVLRTLEEPNKPLSDIHSRTKK